MLINAYHYAHKNQTVNNNFLQHHDKTLKLDTAPLCQSHSAQLLSYAKINPILPVVCPDGGRMNTGLRCVKAFRSQDVGIGLLGFVDKLLLHIIHS